MQTVAEEIGCEQLTLIAGTRAEMKLFGLYGFDVEDSDLGRFGVEQGVAIMMDRNVRP
jgi:hypothetical protein